MKTLDALGCVRETDGFCLTTSLVRDETENDTVSGGASPDPVLRLKHVAVMPLDGAG